MIKKKFKGARVLPCTCFFLKKFFFSIDFFFNKKLIFFIDFLVKILLKKKPDFPGFFSQKNPFLWGGVITKNFFFGKSGFSGGLYREGGYNLIITVIRLC